MAERGRENKKHRSRPINSTKAIEEQHLQTSRKTINMKDDSMAWRPHTKIEKVKKKEESDLKDKKTTVRRVKSIEKNKERKDKCNKNEKDKNNKLLEVLRASPELKERKRAPVKEVKSKWKEERGQEKGREKEHAATLSKRNDSNQTSDNCTGHRKSVGKISKQKSENQHEKELEIHRKNTKIKELLKRNKRIHEKHHYSDSEIETTKIYQKPADSSVFYDLLSEEKSLSPRQHKRCEHWKRRHSKKDLKESSNHEQSSIRNKLIKILFKRVKELLKETEQLREERKNLTEQIISLTEQVEIMKSKDEDQVMQGQRMKEKVDVITEGTSIPGTGKSLKEEIHGILHNIQQKYAHHWQEHEKKIQQMQSHAENEIQFLMENIVCKYVQMNELRNRASTACHFLSDSQPLSHNILQDGGKETNTDVGARYTKPLFINTNQMESKEYYEDNRDLLLKIAEPRRCSTISSPLTSFEKFETAVPRLFESQNQHSCNDNLPQTKHSLCEENGCKGTNINNEITKTSKTNQNIPFSLIPKKVPSRKEDKNSKEELKQFWRHRLLQPNLTETMQKDKQQETKNMRNQF